MILHVDMDAFYASVEQRDSPELRGRPVAVGGSASGRGVVAAASYEARRFGVHSAMPMAKALRLCPELQVVKGRHHHYAQISRQIRGIFARYTPEIEPLSLDEAFLDVTGTEHLFGTAEEIGRQIKHAIKDELSLVASVGIAQNKFLAKLASDLDKPDGFTVIPTEGTQEFISPLKVKRIWGVGKVADAKLARHGLSTFGDFQRLTEQQAVQILGSSGEHFWRLAHGYDSRKVVSDRKAKSISHETTFAADISDISALKAWLLELTETVARRLRTHDRVGKTVTIKVRYSDFHTVTRSHSLDAHTDVTEKLWAVAADMLEHELPQRKLVVRLLGMGIANLEQARTRQLSLFDEEQDDRNSQLDQANDKIRDLFGKNAIRRATSIANSTELKRSPHSDDLPKQQ